MQQVVVTQFGGPAVLRVEELETPEPGPGQVRLKVTSIGMNHAELMARRGAYKLISGEPPFVPGMEAGGVVERSGPGVTTLAEGQRVTLSPAAPRLPGGPTPGTYRSHFIAPAEHCLPVPETVPDEQLGALWLAYLTGWGCLVHKQAVGEGDWVALGAASSSVALAAAQIVRDQGGVAIGLTSHPDKVARLQQLDGCAYDFILVTHEADGSLKPWHREMRELTQGGGINVFFDPVAAGGYLSSEIKSLASFGTVWIYGLLGGSGEVDLTPLIRKSAAVRGFALSELIEAGESMWRPGCEYILEKLREGTFRQHVDRTFRLAEVAEAHAAMEAGEHMGKLVLVP
jgi:NADPH:quinone reductase-like Zn-dependent oxidoreductase